MSGQTHGAGRELHQAITRALAVWHDPGLPADQWRRWEQELERLRLAAEKWSRAMGEEGEEP